MTGRRADGTNPRATGTNPRATGTNPRAQGTNPRALQDPDEIVVEVWAAVRDEGTVVVFDGVNVDTGDPVQFAVDHRPARDLLDDLRYEDRPVQVLLEPWQILRRR